MAVDWKSFWNENPSISRIILDQPELTLELPLAPTPEEPMGWQFPAIQQLVFRNGKFHLLHKFSDETTQALDWEMIQLTVTQAEKEGPSLIRLSARIPNPQLSSALTLNGMLELLEKDGASPNQEELSGFPAMKVQGKLEVSQYHLGRLVQFLRGHALETPIQT